MTRLATIAPALLLAAGCAGDRALYQKLGHGLGAHLHEEPWAMTDAGNVGVFGQLGVYEDYKTVTAFTVDDPGKGPVVVEQSYDLIGKFGGIGGVEFFIAKDLSLLAGVDFRVFEPEPQEGFILEEVSTLQRFLGLRWITPPRWLAEGRLRSFLEGGIGYIPSTSFDGEVDLPSGFTGISNPTFQFDGDSYWTANAAAGLLYQLTDRLVGQLRFTYEFPLSSTRDQVEVAIPPTTLTYEMGIEQEPQGLLVQLGLAYYF